MKHLVATECGPAALAQRRFPQLFIAPDSGRGPACFSSARYQSVLSTLSRCAQATGVGFGLRFDRAQKKLIFDTIHGTDRSADQEDTSRVLFSKDYDTLYAASLFESQHGSATVLYVCGGSQDGHEVVSATWEGKEPEGFYRRERSLDAPWLTTPKPYSALGIHSAARIAAACYLRQNSAR